MEGSCDKEKKFGSVHRGSTSWPRILLRVYEQGQTSKATLKTDSFKISLLILSVIRIVIQILKRDECCHV